MSFFIGMFGRLLIILVRKGVIDLKDVNYITGTDRQFYIYMSELMKEERKEEEID